MKVEKLFQNLWLPGRTIWRKLVLLFVLEVFITIATAPLLVFYGPFENVKSTVVGMLWNSSRFGFVDRIFLSDQAIKRIITDNQAVDPTVRGTASIETLHFGAGNSDKIDIYDINGYDYKGRLMIVYDPARIKVGYSELIPRSGQSTSAIARRNKAVAAINAGGFGSTGWTGSGGLPMGFVIHEGKVVYKESNDENRRWDTAAFTRDGMLIVGRHSLKQLEEYGVNEAVSFGPPLIVNGEPTITKGDGGWGIAPRTAIGQRENGEVILLVIDGRSFNSFGATLKDLQDILLRFGAVNAVNLDGGSSSTMYFNGKIINKPSSRLGERTVPTVFMVVPSKAGDSQ